MTRLRTLVELFAFMARLLAAAPTRAEELGKVTVRTCANAANAASNQPGVRAQAT